MRPYLAIIKDSFRAALASKVLYVLLGLIILFLAVIAPLHVRESLDTRVNLDRDVRPSNQAILIDRIKEELANDENNGMQRIWESLSQETKDKVDKLVGSEGEKKANDVENIFAAQSVVKELNDLIEDPEFFRQQDWEGASLGSEAQDYVDSGVDSLTTKQRQRLNRVLVSESFGGLIKPGARSSLDFFYGPFDWSAFMANFIFSNVSREQFASQISGQITLFLDKIVLSIGLLIAILVTANVVPQTFEAGTLNLLLSKPMARTGLFLAKFVGGCMFIALCASLLFVGLWLWMGLGLGIWERAVLISIPLYIIVFAIYYSVSAFTGLVTRSTILAIVATGLFWVACWSVGMLYLFFSSQMEAFEISKVIQTGDNILQVDPGLEPLKWNDANAEWEKTDAPELGEEEKIQRMVFRYMGDQVPFPDPLGPVFVNSSNRTAYSRVLVGDPITHRKQQFFISNDKGNFVRKGSLPSGVTAMEATKSNILCVNRRGRFYRYDPELTSDDEKKPETWFTGVGPDKRIDARESRQVAVNYQSEEIAIYKDGEVVVFAVDESTENKAYKRRVASMIDTGTSIDMTCHVAYQGDTILLALGNGQVIALDSESLEKKFELLPESRVGVESIAGSKDGRWFSLLYRDETVRMLDVENETASKPSFRGQGSISAIQFTDDKVLVADRTDRVTSYQLDGFVKEESKAPSGTWMQKAWRYAIKPVYFAFPKPGEFYKVVTHLSSSRDAERNRDVDLTFQKVRPNPWSPLISGLVFMAVMLAISCITFSRTDY